MNVAILHVCTTCGPATRCAKATRHPAHVCMPICGAGAGARGWRRRGARGEVPVELRRRLFGVDRHAGQVELPARRPRDRECLRLARLRGYLCGVGDRGGDAVPSPGLARDHGARAHPGTSRPLGEHCMSLVSATIITGFLGAGKTTLLRHVLEHAGGRRIAVIVNEFGALGIDGDTLRSCGIEGCTDDDVIELANGCLCCNRRRRFPADDGEAARPRRSTRARGDRDLRAGVARSRCCARSTGRASAPA